MFNFLSSGKHFSQDKKVKKTRSFFSESKSDEPVDVKDFSTLPTDDDFKYILDLALYNINWSDYQRPSLFWNPQTGKLGISEADRYLGVPILTGTSLMSFVNYSVSETPRMMNLLKGHFKDAQVRRLQVITDLQQLPEQANWKRVAELISQNYIISDEVPYELMTQIYAKLLTSLDDDSNDLYLLFLKMIRMTKSEFIKSMMPGLKIDNPDAISFFVNQMRKNTSNLAHKVLIVANRFAELAPGLMPSIESALWFNVELRCRAMDAWDNGDGQNLGLLNQLMNTLKQKTFWLSDDFFEVLGEGGYEPKFIWQAYHDNEDIFPKISTNELSQKYLDADDTYHSKH